MATEAARTTAAAGKRIINYHLRDVVFGKAAVLPTNGSVEVQIALRHSDDATRNFLEWSEYRIVVFLFQGQDSTEAGRGSAKASCYGARLSFDRLQIDHWFETALRYTKYLRILLRPYFLVSEGHSVRR